MFLKNWSSDAKADCPQDSIDDFFKEKIKYH
jgi:hypothetical protein